MTENPTPEPQGTAQWKSRPVFISSTFRDMQWERDYLNRHIFPRLAEELAKRHHHLEPIDLRLGVEAGQADSEEARELLVLKVCLDEIKRSRPFLLVLLGDRYGWVPPPERIETAAREQGMETSPVGKSVTALEIEFGILRDPENPNQKSRSLFFFRQPLPYADMPDAVRADYSDAHSPDPQVRAGHAKLTDLKAALQRDPELAGRLHDYSVGWDAERQKVTDLEAFGNLVFEKLWSVIDEETKDWAAKPAPTWEEQERAGLAEFIEHRSRGFTGRKDLLEKLRAIATSSTETPTTDHRNTGLLTGTPGSGKSALFAQLHRDLEKDPSLLILANAAGGTQRGSSVDSMLRRWIGEMHAFLEPVEPPKQDAFAPIESEPQVADSGPKPNAISFRRKTKQLAGPMPKPRTDLLPASASNDDVEAAFYSLLHRVSSVRRVVVLLDALDQFEPTPRGRHLTWFKPQQWPPNARLIATAIPGPASSVLAKAPDTAALDLPPLTAADAQAIGTHVWGRYHRTLNPAVLAVLIEKQLPDGPPACGNPLWLTLALEQLNLLDADDFARAEREFTGSPGERLAALLLDTARNMPPDITSLYGWLLEQNEKAFGLAETRAFATAIALSRNGWRESDLLDLVPRLAQVLDSTFKIQNSKFDILSLSTLRRSFRAHLVRRGEHEQLDFFHAQMRRAVLTRCMPDETQRRVIHAAISDYLETLPLNDPLIRFERMSQLIGERNATRAGAYYATVQADAGDDLTSERLGSTWTLVDWIVEAERGEQASLVLRSPQGEEGSGRNHDTESPNNPHLTWITSWLTDPGLNQDKVYCLTRNFQFGLLKGIVNRAVLSTRQHLLEAVRTALEQLASADPSNVDWKRDLGLCQSNIGDTLRAQGNLAGARDALLEDMVGIMHLGVVDPSNAALRMHDLRISFIKYGEVLRDQGNLDGALNAFLKAMEITTIFATKDPSNAYWQHDLAVNYERIGSVLQAKGDLVGTLNTYFKSLAITTRCASADPSNTHWQHCLSISHIRIGDVLRAQNNLTGALNAFRDSMVIAARLVATDPSNVPWQQVLESCHINIGDVLRMQGDLKGAVKAYRESLAITTSLAATDPSNAEWRNALSVSHGRIASGLQSQGDLAGALIEYRESLAITKNLAAADPSNANMQRGLGFCYGNIGDVLNAQGDLRGALDAYRDSLVITANLAAANPSNDDWQHDLCVNHLRIGEVLQALGDFAGALNAHRESLAITSHHAATHPSNAKWQHSFVSCHGKLGETLLAQGDLTGALNALRETQTLISRLASEDPSNVSLQRNLFVTYGFLAKVSERISVSEASEWWSKAYAQLSSMKQRGIMPPTDEKTLTALRQKVDGLAEDRASAPLGHPAPRGPISPPRVSQTPAVTPKIMTTEELRTSANENFRNRRWEAAETYYTRLLDQGDPLAEIVPRLVACLLNAHEEISPATRARIEDMLAKLESAGHADLARQVRATYTARLPTKPWWKLWK